MKLQTEVEVAAQLRIDPQRAVELRRKHNWPHVRLGRFDIRYTDEQVEQIVAQHTETTAPQATTAGPVTITGQTARSAGRKRSG